MSDEPTIWQSIAAGFSALVSSLLVYVWSAQSKRIEDVEDSLEAHKDGTHSRLLDKLEEVARDSRAQFATLRMENREDFAAIHEKIESLRD